MAAGKTVNAQQTVVMRRVSVSEARNDLYALVEEVRRGESLIVTHNGEPVARIKPYLASAMRLDEAAERLVGRQVADPPRTALNVERFLAEPAPRLCEGFSASGTVAKERDQSR
ncbi:MAG: type II toxin-antitoxin system prevent-host-death family antitoxin [Chloroflexi bacterium]|nr:type II toxin-antitoxin system prevent-host-death family antitoxin [Chloroflexota bacterium]